MKHKNTQETRGIGRRRFLQGAGGVLLGMGFGVPSILRAAEKAGEGELIAGAKKEGKLVGFGASSIEDVQPLLDAFMKAYPFVNAVYTEVSGSKGRERMRMEYEQGQRRVDFFEADSLNFGLLEPTGMFAPVIKEIPNIRRIPAEYYDETSVAFYIDDNGMAYNTKLVTKEDAPRTYRDLLRPRWKGKKLAIDVDPGGSKTTQWFGLLTHPQVTPNPPYTVDFFRELAKQDLFVQEGHTLLTKMLGAGEFHVFVNNTRGSVVRQTKKGAPILFQPPEDAVALYVARLGIINGAPHPSAARLFINWFLTPEASSILAKKRDSRVANPKAHQGYEFPRGVRVIMDSPRIAQFYAEINRQWKEIWTGRG